MFYNINKQEITKDKWVKEFEHFYFLNGLTYGSRITSKNQGSKFVEDKIEEILKNGLKSIDIPLVNAWKIGAIDHKASELQRDIIYKNNFDKNFEFPDQYGHKIRAGYIINYCQHNFDYLIKISDEAEHLYNVLFQNRGLKSWFGEVKCFSLLYFFTRGTWPIYDKFAHVALNAISSNKLPGDVVPYKQVTTWSGYQRYADKIDNLFGSKNIPREIDRSLWVYGHFFKNEESRKNSI